MHLRYLSICAFILATTLQLSHANEKPFWIGINQHAWVRPLFLWNGKWSNPWPNEPNDGHEPVPAKELKDVPTSWTGGERDSLGKWTIWERDGTSKTVTTPKAALAPAACVRMWAMFQNEREQEGNQENTYAKGAASTLAEALTPFLKTPLDLKDLEDLKKKVNLLLPTNAHGEFRFDLTCTSTNGLCFFSASREEFMVSDPDCGAKAHLYGYVQKEKGWNIIHSHPSRQTGCDMIGDHIEPLALILRENRRFIFSVRYFYEGGNYQLEELKNGELLPLFSADGGGC